MWGLQASCISIQKMCSSTKKPRLYPTRCCVYGYSSTITVSHACGCGALIHAGFSRRCATSISGQSFNLSWWRTLISCGPCRVSQRAGVIRQAPPRRGSSAAEHLYFVRQSRSLRPAGRDTACNRTIPYIFQRSGFVTLCCR